jgi:hypothetical protein
MGKSKTIMLRTSLSVEDCLRRLVSGTDIAKRTIFSLSGYKGSNPVLATFDGNRFRLRKRRYYRNDFAPIFFGTLSAEGQGTQVEGHFDMDPWVKIFMGVWLGFVILMGIPILISTLSGNIEGDARVGLIVPPAMILFGLLLPKFGRLIGRGEENFLREFLKNTLAAKEESSDFVISQRSIENKPL